jgi:hypothetical protein
VYGMSPGVRCKDADGLVVLRHTGTDRQRGRTMSLVMTIRVRPRCAPTSAVAARPSRVSGAVLAAWQDLRPRDVRQARARLRRRARPGQRGCAACVPVRGGGCALSAWVHRGPTARGGGSGRVPVQLRGRRRGWCSAPTCAASTRSSRGGMVCRSILFSALGPGARSPPLSTTPPTHSLDR